MAALTFGVLREKTGTSVAPGIAHGLPNAVGEGMNVIFSWIERSGYSTRKKKSCQLHAPDKLIAPRESYNFCEIDYQKKLCGLCVSARD